MDKSFCIARKAELVLAQTLLMFSLLRRHGGHIQALRSLFSKPLFSIKLDIISPEKLLTMYFGDLFVRN